MVFVGVVTLPPVKFSGNDGSRRNVRLTVNYSIPARDIQGIDRRAARGVEPLEGQFRLEPSSLRSSVVLRPTLGMLLVLVAIDWVTARS